MALAMAAPWVVPYLESPWVKLAAFLAPDFPSPDGGVSGDAWRRFLLGCSVCAVLPLLLGWAVGIAVLVRSCMVKRVRGRSQPKARALVCVSRSAVLLALAGLVTLVSVGYHGVSTGVANVSAAAVDAESVESAGIATASNVEQIFNTVATLAPTCSPAVQEQLSDVKKQIMTASITLRGFNEDVVKIRGYLDRAHTTANSAKTVSLFVLVLPSVFVLACCCSIMHLVRKTRRRRLTSGSCNHCILRSITVCLFVPTVMLIALVTAGEVFVGVSTGSFCRNVDTNVLTYTHHFASDLAYNVSSYYITGKGSNPLVRDLGDANASLTQASRLLAEIRPTGASDCKVQTAVDSVTKQADEAGNSMSAATRILSPEHVYSYYKVAVHDELCSAFISSVGWLVVSQFLLGIVFLPSLACMASSFYEQWAASRVVDPEASTSLDSLTEGCGSSQVSGL